MNGIPTRIFGNFRRSCRTAYLCRALLAVSLWALGAQVAKGGYGELELRFTEATDPDRLLAVRLHLTNSKGKVVKAKGVPAWQDHMFIEGLVVLKLVPDFYRFTVERGPEYRDIRGSFQIESEATDNQQLAMQRIVDMRGLGWWSGDLLTRRASQDLVRAMLADDLHVACNFPPQDRSDDSEESLASPPGFAGVISRANRLMETDGGRVAFLEVPPGPISEHPFRAQGCSGEAIVAARKVGVRHITAVDPNAWDLPMWLASRRLDSIMVFGPSLMRNGTRPSIRGARPHDERRYAGPVGIGQWSEAVYFDVLNSGLRIPPVAGSGSGFNANPLGYNRVYAYVPGEFTVDAWWEAIAAGRVIVTNGPLLIPSVNGERPGHVFRAPAGQQLELHPALTLYTREPIDYLELIKDGQVVQSVPLERFLSDNGKLPPIPFERSGWLIIRAVTSNKETFRGVMTGPYYVQIGDAPAVRQPSCRVLREWSLDRARQMVQPEAVDREAVPYHRAATNFWQQQLDAAE